MNERYATIENRGGSPLLAKVYRLFNEEETLINEKTNIKLAYFHFVSFSNPEGGENEVGVRNLSKEFHIETFVGDKVTMTRKGLIAPGRQLILELDTDQRGLLILYKK